MSKTYNSRYAAKKAARHQSERLGLDYEIRDGFESHPAGRQYWYPLFFCTTPQEAAKAKEADVEYLFTKGRAHA